MYLLREQYADDLTKRPALRKRIAREVKTHPLTVKRWAEENHPNLTIYTVLDILAKEHFVKISSLVKNIEI